MSGPENGGAPTRLWGGRFGGGPSEALAALSVTCTSTGGWRRTTSPRRGRTPGSCTAPGCSSDAELGAMLGALDDLDAAVRDGSFRPTVEDEDVHTALERGLLERVGALGGKLRAGRSRNDQVATDLRLYLRDAARQVTSRVAELETALIGLAERHRGTAMPGMTHLQHAQPVLLAHHLLAHVHAFKRDVERFRDWDGRAALSPLGAGALAGSSLPLDPVAVAAELGFDAPCRQLHRRRVRPRLRGRVLLRRGVARRAPVAAGRGDLPLGHDRVRLGRARRRLRHRLVDHAAEEEPGRRRAGPRQVRPADRQPDGAAHDPQGAAAGLRPGPAGGQGAGLRLGRAAAAGAARDGRHGRDAAASTTSG